MNKKPKFEGDFVTSSHNKATITYRKGDSLNVKSHIVTTYYYKDYIFFTLNKIAKVSNLSDRIKSEASSKCQILPTRLKNLYSKHNSNSQRMS